MRAPLTSVQHADIRCYKRTNVLRWIDITFWVTLRIGKRVELSHDVRHLLKTDPTGSMDLFNADVEAAGEPVMQMQTGMHDSAIVSER